MPGIADHGLCKTCAQRLDHSVDMCLRGNDPADRGAFLTCLRGHLALDFLDEQIELRRAGDRIGAKDRGVQAVLFGDKTNGVAQDMRGRAELESCVGRACKADHVLTGQPVKHVAQTARDKL